MQKEDLKIIQEHFHSLILERNKYNDVFLAAEHKELPIISNETRQKEEWYAVPGMYGGFAYQLVDKDGKLILICSSWCRVVGGSGQRHEITTDGCVLVEEGFV